LDTTIYSEKIGAIVQVYLKEALENREVSKEEISILQDPAHSKQMFGINFPLLSKDRTFTKLKDGRHQYRYYKNPVNISGNKYFLCSQWFESSREKLTVWLEQKGIVPGAASTGVIVSKKHSKTKSNKKHMINNGLDATVFELWRQYNIVHDGLKKAMGSTANIVAEISERLVAMYYDGKQLTASHKSADIVFNDKNDGDKEKLIQVKSRRLKKLKSSSLGVFRSWEFDYLVVVVFSVDGATVLKAICIGVDYAEKIADENKHERGWKLSTNDKLFNHPESLDITDDLNTLIKNLK